MGRRVSGTKVLIFHGRSLLHAYLRPRGLSPHAFPLQISNMGRAEMKNSFPELEAPWGVRFEDSDIVALKPWPSSSRPSDLSTRSDVHFRPLFSTEQLRHAAVFHPRLRGKGKRELSSEAAAPSASRPCFRGFCPDFRSLPRPPAPSPNLPGDAAERAGRPEHCQRGKQRVTDAPLPST